MRIWTRFRMPTPCGGQFGRCLRSIPAGEPVQVVTLAESSVKRYRCRNCAGEAPPADLPPLAEEVAITPMVKLKHAGIGALPFDFKATQAGREPGEDD